jgi:hypothetical protein
VRETEVEHLKFSCKLTSPYYYNVLLMKIFSYYKMVCLSKTWNIYLYLFTRVIVLVYRRGAFYSLLLAFAQIATINRPGL